MIKTKIKTVVFAASVLFGVSQTQANVFDNLVEAANGALATYGRADAPSRRTDLTREEVTIALRELLTVGSANVVARLEAHGYDQPAVRIELPRRWSKAKSIAARIGYRRQFEELETSLAQTAVAVAPQTRELLNKLIAGLDIEDPRSVLHGGGAAATRQLQIQVTEQLALQLHPIVGQTLDTTGTIKAKNEIARNVKHLPLVKLLETDFTGHVVEKSLHGFFHYLAEEERAVRARPEKRTTELLRRVFG